MITLKATVHSVSECPMEVQAVVGGKPTKAWVQGLVVELASSEHGHTFRLGVVDPEIREMFTEGAEVDLTLSPSQTKVV